MGLKKSIMNLGKGMGKDLKRMNKGMRKNPAGKPMSLKGRKPQLPKAKSFKRRF